MGVPTGQPWMQPPSDDEPEILWPCRKCRNLSALFLSGLCPDCED